MTSASFGNGLNTSTVPTWQSECSRSHRRGQLVMIEGAMITGGICFSYWLDFGFSFLDPSTIAWRFPIGFQIFFAVLILLFILELPESPRWLILKGREDEAMSVLSALSDLPPDDVRPWFMLKSLSLTLVSHTFTVNSRPLKTLFSRCLKVVFVTCSQWAKIDIFIVLSWHMSTKSSNKFPELISLRTTPQRSIKRRSDWMA